MIQAKQITAQALNQQQEIFSSVNADFVLVADSTDSFNTKKVTRSNFLSGLATTLQNAYNNSTTPEIVTDATRVALTLRRGSAADTDLVLEVQNGAAVTKFSVSGNGLVGSIGNEFTSVAANPGVVAAQTLWANSSDSNKLYYGAAAVLTAGLIISSGLTMATNRILGRTTAATGVIEEITVGTGLTLSAGTLTNNFSGTVSSVAISSTDLSVLGSPITTSGTFTLNINTNAVTNAKLAQVATATFKGRTTAGTGNVEDLTVSQAKTLLNLTGTNSGDQTITLTGDVTGTGTGSFATTIANGVVSLAKMTNLAANSIIGNNTGGSAVPIALTGTQVTAMLDNFTSALKGLVPLSGGGTVNFLRADGTWTTPVGTLTGSGTINRLSKWTSSIALGDSLLSEATTTVTLNAGVTSTNSTYYATGSIADFLQYDIKNSSTGTGAQSGYSATADNGSTTTGFIWVGINNSGTPLVATYNIGAANDVSFLGSGQDMYIANSNNTKDIIVSLGKAATPFFFEVARFANNTGNGSVTLTALNTTITQRIATTGSPVALTLTGAAHTTLTASIEAIDINFNLNRVVQFATGALALQRAMLIQAPTYAFVGASTVTAAVTLDIAGPPVAGTNAILTNTWALRVASGNATFVGRIFASVGSAALPSITFNEAVTGSDTGFYSIGDGQIGVTTNGVLRWTLNTTALTSTLPWLGQNGTATAPALSFSGDSNTGLYNISADIIGIATGGVLRFDISTVAVTSTLKVVTPASIAGAASINLPHGAAPSSPVNGDEWTTTAGKFIRVNGVTTNVSRLVTTLTDGATINIDAATGDVFTVTIAGNRTIAAPTNPVNGRLMMLRIRQDATGSRTITWNAAFAFTAGLPAPTLTTGANKIDYVGFVYDSTTAKWHCISYVLGHN